MQRKRVNRKQKETTNGGEIEAMLYFPGISQRHKEFMHWETEAPEDKLLSGSWCRFGVPVPVRSKPNNQDNTLFACCLQPSPLAVRPSAYRQDTVYALHPKDEPVPNLRSAVNHQALLLPKARKHLIMCFQLCQRKGPCPVLILFGSQK